MSSGNDKEVNWDALNELIAERLRENGAANVRVSDGQVFFFTTECLEKLLAASIENGGTAMIFVKRAPEA